MFDLSPMWVSLKTTVTATFITFFIGIIAAYFMEGYHGKLKGVMDTVLILPLVLPPTVVGFFLLLVFGTNGPIGKFLMEFNASIIFSWPSTVISASVVAFPLMYKTTRSSFEQIDTNIINAAKTLGVSEWTVFWRIMMPLAWPGVVVGTVLVFTRALGEFGATLMVAGNIPNKTQTIPMAIYFAAESGEMGKALIWVILIVFISMIVIVLMNYWSEYEKKLIYGVRG